MEKQEKEFFKLEYNSKVELYNVVNSVAPHSSKLLTLLDEIRALSKKGDELGFNMDSDEFKELDHTSFPVEEMCVNIKVLSTNAVIPTYAKEGDAGLDLTATSYKYENGNHIYGVGLAFAIPKGYVGLLFPRSSNRKTNAYMCNHVGVLDSGYRGEVFITFKNRDDRGETFDVPPYKIGDRIAQLIVVPYPLVRFFVCDELDETERGEGGHGSTGK